MNSEKTMEQPKIRKESKRKIKVDFERTPLKERLKAKFLSMFFLKKFVWWIVRYVLLVGVAYIVLFPFISKIAASFMEKYDLADSSVKLIPKNFTVEIYRELWLKQEYIEAFMNTLGLSLTTALIQMFICSLVAYGFAKFRFKGNKLLFGLVILTMVIPHRTIQLAMFSRFNGFDIFGIFSFLEGGGINILGFEFNNEILSSINVFPDSWKMFTSNGINTINTMWPFILLSLTGLAFKNGLYIFLLRQFFMGVPDELEESAYIDGSGVFRTFFTIILPISVPMMITVFLFAFSWCWTDDFYTGRTMFFFDEFEAPYLLINFIEKDVPKTLIDKNFKGQEAYNGVVRNTAGLMVIAPLVVMYLFCQKYLVQGIERSGLTAD